MPIVSFVSASPVKPAASNTERNSPSSVSGLLAVGTPFPAASGSIARTTSQNNRQLGMPPQAQTATAAAARAATRAASPALLDAHRTQSEGPKANRHHRTSRFRKATHKHHLVYPDIGHAPFQGCHKTLLEVQGLDGLQLRVSGGPEYRKYGVLSTRRGLSGCKGAADSRLKSGQSPLSLTTAMSPWPNRLE